MRAFVDGQTVAVVDEVRGGRIAVAQFGGQNVLHTVPDGDPLAYGSYPMVPWAGRVRHGRFSFADADYVLPLGLPPHAIHGTAFVRRWHWHEDGSLRTDLGSEWPFAGRVEQRFTVREGAITVSITVRASEAMPAMVGWHPWFRRHLASGATAVLEVEPVRMYELATDDIPTGELIDVSPGPWDNCFSGMATNPVIRWPGFGEVEISSTLDHWVIYDQTDHAICVEPQSGAPDEFNREPHVITPDRPLEASYTLEFRP